jgi:asparagine synthetase B (glutamine-hydrolysing)
VTHSNHRQGTRENLRNDWVMLSLPYRGPPAVMEKVEKYKEICRRHHPINPDRPRAWYIWVFDDRENMQAALKELAEAELGLPVVVSGLFDEVAECCSRAGTRAHTVNHSLGFWGKTEKLPPREILEITTMCGHGLVAPRLVWQLAERMASGDTSASSACQEMRMMCICDIFNHIRAEELMGQLVSAIEEGWLAPPQPSRGAGGSLAAK